MRTKEYRVELTDEERAELLVLVRRGKAAARTLTRAHILLAAGEDAYDADTAAALHVSTKTVERVRHRFAQAPPGNRLRWALDDLSSTPRARRRWWRWPARHPRTSGPCGRCSCWPTGWSSSTSSTRSPTKPCGGRWGKNRLKPWQHQHWCRPTVGAAFVAPMEDVLDLYAEAPDPERPLVCFDEKPVQLLSDVRAAEPCAPGRPRREDYEYTREGTCNVFLSFAPHLGWRQVDVTERRTALDVAHQLRRLVDVDFPEATVIRLVWDNLNVHRLAVLYEAFPPAEARRIARRLELHPTPKHASWLNMAELELGVLDRQCLAQRLPSREAAAAAASLWQAPRNAARVKVTWRFTTDAARHKLARLYPALPS